LEPVTLDIRMMNHSGIGSYLRGLLEGMALVADAPSFLFYGPPRFRAMIPERLCELYVLRDYPVYTLTEQLRFPESLRFQSLFHAPHYNIPLRFRGRLIVTIHDLNHLVFEDSLPTFLHRQYARFMHREVAARASHIITVSEKTRKEVLDILEVSPERVTTILPGIGRDFGPCEDAGAVRAFQEKRGLPGSYLLCVGIHKPHKNYPFLIQSLAALWKGKKLDLPLVIAGPEGKRREDLERIGVEAKTGDHVFFPGRISREEMPLVYAGAALLVFPSLYEGFGLPPLEAMKCGIPVLSSNRDPMPEVIGDAGVFFDPLSMGDFQENLLQILSDLELQKDLVEKGRQRAERFDWVDTARETIRIYRQVLGDGDNQE